MSNKKMNSLFEFLSEYLNDPKKKLLSYLGYNFTQESILNEIYRVKNYLQKSGIKNGDIVSLMLPNIPAFVFAFYGASANGSAVSLVSPYTSAMQLKEQLIKTKSKFIFIWDYVYNDVKQVLDELKINAVVCSMKDYAKKIFFQNIEKFNTNVDNVTKYGNLPFPEKNDEHIYVKSTRNAPALLSNTGGTTGGFPKIVVTSAYKINFLIRKNYNELFAKRFKIHSRIGLTDLPLTSAVAPTYCLHLGLCYADKYVILPTELPEIKFEIMTQNNITFYITHHSIIGKMIPYKDLCINAFRHLKMLFMNVTAPCDELKENTMKLLPDKCVCADSYGITEMICVTLQRYGKDMGYQIFGGSNLIKDINSNKLLPPFEKGELLIDSEYVMDGYLDGDADKDAFIVITNDVSRSDHNNNAVTGGKRYLRTGDIGYIDEKGLFYYIDRLKRIDRIGGYSIFPAVIENTIMKNKNVINCVVARKKDKNNKPFLTAYLQINGVGDFTQTANEIKADILKNLGKYNVPRQFVFADKIEQTPAGKNNYRYYENSED